MSKIILVNPYITTYGNDSSASVYIPIGLAYLASYLRKYGHQVAILDALSEGGLFEGGGYLRRGMSIEKVTEHINNEKPDIVGISCMYTAYSRDAHEIAAAIKKINPKTLVIFGGAHSSINYNVVLQDKNVDIVVKGEGERAILEIVSARDKGNSFSDIRGIVVNDDGRIRNNPEQDYIANLDEIPFPARDMLQMNIYYKLKSPFWMRSPLDVIVSSRGCPKRCIYCSIHSVWGNRWRARSAKNVVDEIEMLSKNGVREIHFNDDNISADKRRMHEICDEIISRKLDIKWTTPNGIAIWTLDKELLTKMKKSGCYRLTFGIETGNQEMQKYIGKNLDLNYAKKVIKWANDLGLWTVSTHIIGFPKETREEINDTLKFSLRSGTDFALFYPLTPFLGTKVFKYFQDERLIPSRIESLDKSRDYFIGEFAVDTKFFTKDQIIKIETDMYRKFIRYRLLQAIYNPFKIIKKVKNVEDFKYSLKLFNNIFNISRNLFKSKQMGAKTLYGRKK